MCVFFFYFFLNFCKHSEEAADRHVVKPSSLALHRTKQTSHSFQFNQNLEADVIYIVCCHVGTRSGSHIYLLSRKQDKNIPLSLLFPPICSPPLISLFFHRLQIIYPILFLTCKGKFMAVSSTVFEVLSLDSISDTFGKRSVFRARTYWESMLSIYQLCCYFLNESHQPSSFLYILLQNGVLPWIHY